MINVREIPPVAWLGAAFLLGWAGLAWHRYSLDKDDRDWTTPSEIQPQVEGIYSPTPGPGTGRPMDTSAGFRSRGYPDNLASAAFSIIGEIG